MTCPSCGATNPDSHKYCGVCRRPLAAQSGDDAPTRHGLVAGVGLGPKQRYRLVRRLGAGGMGEVWLADDTVLGTPVAIKTVKPLLMDDPGAVARLLDEARAAMGLAHPNVVRVNHLEQDSVLTFLVMEYVEGETLATRLARERRLPAADVRRIGLALTDALGHAHSRTPAILHRDVKPANVLLGRDGRVKLVDFGIARVARDSISRLTGVQTSGTLLYMAPEAVRGKATGPPSDWYSLGTLLYECVAGTPPFHSGDLTHQILHETPELLTAADHELATLIERLLAKDPAARPSFIAIREVLDGTVARWKAEAARPTQEAEEQRRKEASGRFKAAREAQQEAERAAESTVAHGLGIRWARIPAGTFQMGCVSGDGGCDGDEKPRHAVTLTKPYELMTTAVTLGMFRAYATATGRSVPAQPDWNTNDPQPVVNVTWDEALAFCGWFGGRLPTEAEWERAARGGTDGAKYPWGDQAPVSTAGANNGARFASESTLPVARFAANAFGLFDMAGNVWEWVADWYGPYANKPVSDPRGPSSGSRRVVRGGSWGNNPWDLRVSFRNFDSPGDRNYVNGFRCARDVFP